MLNLITKSKIRKRIILLFLHNPATEYSLSDVARQVATSAGTAQRELNRLLQNDLLTFKKRSGLNIYSLNKKCAVLKEIESIVNKTIGVEVELKNRLEKITGISYAFIFGSYAKGGVKSDSDIDLFVIGDMKEDEVFKAVSLAENAVGRE
ncbi:MAG: nucleotidyltransferase domain-containing protein, partial [Candidatus Margulisiibacteriota bacterium]